MLNITRCFEMLVEAGLPVNGLTGPSSDDGPWEVHWSTRPTSQQKTQADSIQASFDPSPTARQQWIDQKEPAFATIRDQAQQALTDIDTYLAIADTATAAQVRAEVKAIDQRQRKIIQALLRVIVRTWRS